MKYINCFPELFFISKLKKIQLQSRKKFHYYILANKNVSQIFCKFQCYRVCIIKYFWVCISRITNINLILNGSLIQMVQFRSINLLNVNPTKMVKQTQTIRRLQPTNCLSVFDPFMRLTFKGRTEKLNPFLNQKKEILLSINSRHSFLTLEM